MRAATFASCGVLPELVDKVSKSLGAVLTPTCIQRKSLPVVLEGRSAVINAETGSGKTLCFLLPVLQNLTKLSAKGPSIRIPSPYSVALVPTPHLANQINSVFSSLADPQWGSTVVHKGSRMLLKPNTHFLVGTPTSIVQYDILKVFRHVRIVCIDEADVLLTGTEQEATWEILKLVKRLHGEDRKRSIILSHDGECSSVPSRQMIFTAATLPSGGPKTVYSLLQKWLPKDTHFITTEATHQIVSMATTAFVDIHDGTAATQTNSSTSVPPSLSQRRMSLKLATLYSDLNTLGKRSQQPKVLVFANTVASVKSICEYLTRKSGKDIGSEEENAAGEWWGGGATKELHKGVPPEEREETLRQFREGTVRVLVCTDLASRGLDLPDITAVIQFDFPGNSADYLHRAGRTARAGREGSVISYVCDSDQDLAWEIQQVLSDRTRSFASIFSRNKMLRRKMKARKTRKLTQ